MLYRLAGLFDESDGNEDSLPEEDEQQDDDELHNGQDDHYGGETRTKRRRLERPSFTATYPSEERRSLLTEGQPGLSDLQVDGEVCLEAQLLYGHVCARFFFKGRILHVAVEDT